MKSSIINGFGANELDFSIKYLKEINIGGVKVHITTTHVALICVSLVLIVFAIVAKRVIQKRDASDTPGTFQNFVEIVVEMLGSMVKDSMGNNARRFVNYISTLFIFILMCNLSGFLGFRPPTADFGVTFTLGMITFMLVHINGIRKNKVGHFTDLFKPIPLFFPINLMGEIAVPISLSLRLFGNILSGTVMMGLIYGLLPVFITAGLPSVLHVYFDVFSGCIQAYVFSMLTMVYVNGKIAD